MWIYLWAFYFVPLIYISVFVPGPYCLDDCSFVVEPEVRQVDSSSFILKSTGMGSHSLLQGIFLTQGSNPGLPH